MSSTYDFIVVGGGPSGCAVATRLSQAHSMPSVLLIEAGGNNEDPSYLIPAERYKLFAKEPGLNWGYKTEPQSHLKNQQIDYSRGKGLGGSTAINFSCWVVGADEDFNEWARLVGDETWSWQNVKERFKKISTHHVNIAQEDKEYINPLIEVDDKSGPLHLSYANPLEKGVVDVFKAAMEVGLGLNTDINSGNPLGFGLGPSCMYQGSRTTASSYLRDAGPNLTILVNAMVSKVLFSEKQAVGIRTIDGRDFFANRDVILSAGALNTPQLLMLSGIGPAEELQKHGVPVVHVLPDVGKHLQDHVFSGVTLIQKPGTNDRMTFEADQDVQLAATVQHGKDKTGPLTSLYCSTPMGWVKSDAVLVSEEFRALDRSIQEQLNKSTVPSFEIATHVPPLVLGTYELQPTDCYLTGITFVMNPQSYGEVTLNSANPLDPPKIEARLLSHPFDRRVLIEGMRKLMDLFEAPALQNSAVKMVGCPRSRSEEHIWDHVSENLFSAWHMCQTVRMGKSEDAQACTDINFKLRGVQNLRVVDLSVIPLIPNNHTQSTAYLVGETAAEKIIGEYQL